MIGMVINIRNMREGENLINKFVMQISNNVRYFLMTKNCLLEIGQVEPPPPPEVPEEGEGDGTGNHNEDNEDPT